jgi:hypothetical protein
LGHTDFSSAVLIRLALAQKTTPHSLQATSSLWGIMLIAFSFWVRGGLFSLLQSMPRRQPASASSPSSCVSGCAFA